MRKFFYYLFLIFIFVSSIGFVNAASSGLESLMSGGNIVTCLTSETVDHKQNQWTSVKALMRLKGSCGSQKNCEIWRCNSKNNEIAEDEKLLEKCASGKFPPNKPICSPEGIAELKKKIAKSVQVKAGCQRVLTFEPSIGDSMVKYGNIDITSDQKFVPHVDYNFYAKGEAGAVITTSEPLGTGNDNSQQIGEITNFEAFSKPGTSQDCKGITWDPYGRVFDASSLEPISDVDVTLIDNLTKKPASQLFESNHNITNLSGVFNILVEKEGGYLLDVLAPITHLFISNPVLHPNYSLIYSDIYYPDTVYIEKKGIATHHDIPLMPKGTSYFQKDIYIIDGTLRQMDMGKFVNYGGRTTFPKTLVCLIGENSKKQAGSCFNADNIGKFSLNIDKTVIPQDERLILQLRKVDLTSKNFSPVGLAFYPVDDNGKNYGFEPIFNYIEGYSYSPDNNQIAPRTKVVIKSLQDDITFYETQTDDSGFFTIYPKNLPIIEYYIEFTDPVSNKVTKLTTSEFVKKNQSYIDSEKINLVQSTKHSQKIINPATGKLNNIVKDDSALQQKNQATSSIKKPINLAILMIALIIFLLVVVTVVIVFYINKPKSI